MKQTKLQEQINSLNAFQREPNGKEFLKIKSSGYTETMFTIQSMLKLCSESLKGIDNKALQDINIIDVHNTLLLANGIIENFNEDFQIFDQIRESKD